MFGQRVRVAGAIDLLVTIYKDLLPSLGGYLTNNGKVDFTRVDAILHRLGQVMSSSALLPTVHVTVTLGFQVEDEVFRRRKQRQDRELQRRTSSASSRHPSKSGYDSAPSKETAATAFPSAVPQSYDPLHQDRVQVPTAGTRRTPCRFYTGDDGSCRKGSSCDFLHFRSNKALAAARLSELSTVPSATIAPSASSSDQANLSAAQSLKMSMKRKLEQPAVAAVDEASGAAPVASMSTDPISSGGGAAPMELALPVGPKLEMLSGEVISAELPDAKEARNLAEGVRKRAKIEQGLPEPTSHGTSMAGSMSDDATQPAALSNVQDQMVSELSVLPPAEDVLRDEEVEKTEIEATIIKQAELTKRVDGADDDFQQKLAGKLAVVGPHALAAHSRQLQMHGRSKTNRLHRKMKLLWVPKGGRGDITSSNLVSTSTTRKIDQPLRGTTVLFSQ